MVFINGYSGWKKAMYSAKIWKLSVSSKHKFRISWSETPQIVYHILTILVPVCCDVQY